MIESSWDDLNEGISRNLENELAFSAFAELALDSGNRLIQGIQDKIDEPCDETLVKLRMENMKRSSAALDKATELALNRLRRLRKDLKVHPPDSASELKY